MCSVRLNCRVLCTLCPVCRVVLDWRVPPGAVDSFCFQCILQWSEVSTSCPMCKTSFTKIIYDVKANDLYNVVSTQSSISQHCRLCGGGGGGRECLCMTPCAPPPVICPTHPDPCQCSTKFKCHPNPPPVGGGVERRAAVVTQVGFGTVRRWSLASLPTGGVSNRVERLPRRRGGGVCVPPCGSARPSLCGCAFCRVVYSLGLRVKPLTAERGRVRVRDICK